MKYLRFSLIFLNTVIFAQVPTGINYQGVARNSSGDVLPNKTISLLFEIKNNSNTLIFSEQHTSVTTNQLGLFSLVIGSKNNSQFNTINWGAGNLFMQVSIDIDGGNVYAPVGNALPFQSVPYSLYAQSIPSGYANGVLTIGTNTYNLNSTSSIPALSYTNNILTVGPPTNSVLISTGTSATNVSLTTSGGAATITSPGTNTFDINIPTTILSGGTNVNINGSYPNYTVNSAPTLNLNGNNLSISGGNTITIPTSGTIAAVTTSIVSSGAATTTILGPNSFSIHVPAPVFTGIGSTTINGTYPNYTINSSGATTNILPLGVFNHQH